ncbi:hypothetical protein [Rhodococcus sp. KRD197]|uniref:hypothetical protein n=1 Tax=Rhodococcus sp. KRD197 TaxID=2729731 RepID=UPI0019CF95DE|nr:hypothetical protein [Rhodococcus sp. KRD197]
MTFALPANHICDQLVGPFYDTAGLIRWWGVSKHAVTKAASTGTVIACQRDGGGWVYPTWQFTNETGTVHPDLLTLWLILRATGDPWTCALWLRAPQGQLCNRTIADWIIDGNPLDDVLPLARAAANTWGR